jgi:intracellular sulfur oxidation DsrE/DsrF family protein
MKDLKIVLHVDQRGGWPSVLSHLLDLIRDYPEAKVRVVVNGDAVYAFRGPTDVSRQLEQIAGAGVQLQVSADSMLEHRLDPATLPDYVKMVPVGIVALAQAQHEGFAYVKP